MQFYKGRTNNHLNFVMVDATDFATPESALSAAIKIKVYGQLRSATGTNFVSSGTGSLTNDITHVGASATGQYHIALAKADLSDASAAWYDHYVVTLSATGAAYQTLIIDGGIDNSYLSDIASDILSTMGSQFAVISNYLSNISAIASDAHSAAILGASTASEAQSNALLILSRLSDLDSRLASDVSDIMSNIDAVTATVSASDISDIASAVWAAKYTANSAASSFGSLFSDIYSRVLLNQSRVSDIQSYLAVMSGVLSDTYSGVSDLQSRTASDIASKVWAEKYTAASNVKASTFGSVLRLNMSRISDVQSYLVGMSGMLSDAHSAAILAASHASDAHSAALLTQSMISDVDSALTSQYSDLASKIGAITVSISASDISDIASATAAAVGFTPSAIAAKVWSDYQSKVGATPSQVYSALLAGASGVSDVYSALTTARSEPAQGAPAASLDHLTKMDYLYKAWRNRTTQTATQYGLYADDATTLDHKATFSDDGTTADRGEVATGP